MDVTHEPTRFGKLRREVLIATWLSYAGFYVARKVFGIVKAPIKAELGLGDLEVSHLWTSFLVAYMIGQFVAAALGRRVSSRNLLLAGMSTSLICNFAMAFLIGQGRAAYVAMIATMAVHGLAQAMGWPHNVALLARWTTRSERGGIMAVWSTCYQLGSIFAKALAAFVFGWLGLASAFSASSIVLMAVCAIFVLWAHESPESRGLGARDTSDIHAAPSRVAMQGATTSEDTNGAVVRTIVAMGLIYFAFKFIRYALESWSTMILEERFAIDTSSAGYLSTTFDILGFLGVVIAGFLSDRSTSRMPVIFAMTVGCLATSILLYWVGLSSATAFVVLLGAMGFMAMGPDALLSGAGAMDVGGKRQAAMAAGVINGLGSIGPIIQEPVIGWLKGASGVSAVFMLLIGVTLTATFGTGVLFFGARRVGLRI